MRKFMAGLILGALIGSSMVAIAATCETGNLNGWTVTWGGNTICTDPHAHVGGRLIECN